MPMSTYGSRKDWRATPVLHTAAPAHGARSLEVGFSWEQELGPGAVEQDTWMLSFVDILMLLLTLFVLLLAYKDDSLPEAPPAVPPHAASRVETVPVAPALPVAVVEPSVVLTQRPDPVEKVAAEVMSEAVQTETVAHASAAESVTATPAEPSLPVSADPVNIPQPFPVAQVAPAPRLPMAPVAGLPGLFGLPADLDLMPKPPSQAPQPVNSESAAPAVPSSRPDVDKLLAELADSSLQGRIEVNVLTDSVSLEISDSILFAPASAALTQDGEGLLNELAATLQAHPYTLSVEGHSDNVPIKTARYPSNWELSSARATEVTRRLIERGIAPERVRAVGYADTHPRADNATVEGRARNRRVTLLLMEQH